ncbi:glycosyltransferase [Microbacterium murale]|nr:glycosyltransferase [Microbacterium murale]
MIDIAERPGLVTATDSLASVFSKFEPFSLRALARRGAIATVAVPSDANRLREWGFGAVIPLRNAPLSSWRAPYADPVEAHELRCVVIGSIFRGRAYEILIQALAICSARGARIKLEIVGPGEQSYLAELQELTRRSGAGDVITWREAVDSDRVSKTYMDAHVGIVLYEPDDPGNDGLSNKILECVSSGRPVLAGDLPENRAFVTENEVGWLTSVTAEAIADALMHIHENADIEEMSRRCRNLGNTSLTWESDFSRVRDALALTHNITGANND